MEKRNVPLDIRVLPFVLPPPKLNYGLYYRKRLHGAPAEKDLLVPAQLMLADFREIRRVGFNGLTIVKMEDVEPMLKLMKEAGMKGPVMLDVGGNPSDKVLTQAVAKARAVGLEMYVYGKDEPGNDPNLLAEQKVLSARYHSIGLKVTTAVDVRSAQRLCDAGQGLDWANLSMDADSVPYLGKLKTGNAKPVAPLMTYYWQVYQENPTLNRLCCGFYLWESGAGGAFPFEFQEDASLLAYLRDARPTMYRARTGGKPRVFRRWDLCYPSQEGPVSTLQWEGCREGVTDVRYLTCLDTLIQEAKRRRLGADASRTQRDLAKVLDACSKLPQSIVVQTDPFADPAGMEAGREKITDLILRLESKLQ